MDFFVVPTLTFRILFVFVVPAHELYTVTVPGPKWKSWIDSVTPAEYSILRFATQRRVNLTMPTTFLVREGQKREQRA